MRELHEIIEEHEEVIEEHKAFEIKDLGTLGWAFQKIAAYQSKKDKVSNYAKAEIEKIKAWQEAELKKHNDSIEFFQSHIERYHFNELLNDPRAKTISTPYGKSKSMRKSPSPIRVDEKVMLDHIVKNDLAEYIQHKPNWGAFKDSLRVMETDDGFVAVDENGEVVPGVIVAPEKTTFTTEVDA